MWRKYLMMVSISVYVVNCYNFFITQLLPISFSLLWSFQGILFIDIVTVPLLWSYGSLIDTITKQRSSPRPSWGLFRLSFPFTSITGTNGSPSLPRVFVPQSSNWTFAASLLPYVCVCFEIHVSLVYPTHDPTKRTYNSALSARNSRLIISASWSEIGKSCINCFICQHLNSDQSLKRVEDWKHQLFCQILSETSF